MIVRFIGGPADGKTRCIEILSPELRIPLPMPPIDFADESVDVGAQVIETARYILRWAMDYEQSGRREPVYVHESLLK